MHSDSQLGDGIQLFKVCGSIYSASRTPDGQPVTGCCCAVEDKRQNKVTSSSLSKGLLLANNLFEIFS